jgi:hypothetical protein
MKTARFGFELTTIYDNGRIRDPYPISIAYILAKAGNQLLVIVRPFTMTRARLALRGLCGTVRVLRAVIDQCGTVGIDKSLEVLIVLTRLALSGLVILRMVTAIFVRVLLCRLIAIRERNVLTVPVAVTMAVLLIAITMVFLIFITMVAVTGSPMGRLAASLMVLLLILKDLLLVLNALPLVLNALLVILEALLIILQEELLIFLQAVKLIAVTIVTVRGPLPRMLANFEELVGGLLLIAFTRAATTVMCSIVLLIEKTGTLVFGGVLAIGTFIGSAILKGVVREAVLDTALAIGDVTKDIARGSHLLSGLAKRRLAK